MRTGTPGMCFVDSGKMIDDAVMEHPELASSLRLCHGQPRNQQLDGSPRYWHAWVELQNAIVFDHMWPTRAVPRKVYYAVGQIEPENVRRYTLQEMHIHLLRSGHWGPWDTVGLPEALSRFDPEQSKRRRKKTKLASQPSAE